jgi:hypothetical protein
LLAGAGDVGSDELARGITIGRGKPMIAMAGTLRLVGATRHRRRGHIGAYACGDGTHVEQDRSGTDNEHPRETSRHSSNINLS